MVASPGDGQPGLPNPGEDEEMGKHRKSKDRAVRKAIKRANKLPKIILKIGELPDGVDRAEAALLPRCEKLQLFQRAGDLVRLISLPERVTDGLLSRPKGSVQLELLGKMSLTEIFNRIARWRRQNSNGNIIRVDCPPKIAAFYISRVGFWRVPALSGIISAPLLRRDGSVLENPGYYSATGLYLVSDRDSAKIPQRPTQADARAALKKLLTPFAEFPFVTAHHQAVHVACILTAIQRPLLGACPIFAYTAPAQRSGKSLLAESIAIIATGKPAPATAISGDREETRKMITSALREGHTIINLDNVEHPLASSDLAKAITQPEYQDRALGSNRMLRLPTNVLWTATGNNLSFRGDLSSRALLCRIDAKVESPESRTFHIPHLRRYLEQHREELIVAALTILRAYHLAGCPQQLVKPWGGFEDWSLSIRESLVWLGMADPCETRSTVIADDPEREETLTALRALREKFGKNVFTTKGIMRRLKSSKLLRTAMEAMALGRNREIDPRSVGWWLRKNHDRIVGGLRLEAVGKASGSARWKIVKVGSGHEGQEGHPPARKSMRFPRLRNS
jgi:putative DNA primase/helicase